MDDTFNEIEVARVSENNDLNRKNNSSFSDLAVYTNHGLPIFPTIQDAKELRPFDINIKRLQHNRVKLIAMEEQENSTQKSNLSLTQENSESVYASLERQISIHQDVPGSNPDFSSSPPIPIERDSLVDFQSNGISGDPNSTHTGSTARTYQEDDTGHINFDAFQPTSAPDEGHYESQDPPVKSAARDFANEHRFEPQTPAPSVNPFSEKGSVMKQHELFGATQPSSIGRLAGSPTSSRPSPDVYDGYRSSQEVETSPLNRRSEAVGATTQEHTRTLLRSISTETPSSATPARILSKAQSFNAPFGKPTFVREPQDNYVSMKESQERRRKLSELEVSSGSESDSDIEALPKKYQDAAREKKIRDEAALVGIRRPNPSSRLSSAKDGKSISIPVTADRPPNLNNHQRASSEGTSSNTPQVSDSTPTAVEVPASGRRRSIQEDYVAHCEGFDARDTQPTQQDMVADSQSAPVSSNFAASSPVPGPRKRTSPATDVEKNRPEPMSPSQRLPKQVPQPGNSDLMQIPDSKITDDLEGVQCTDSNVPVPSDQEQINTLSNEVPVSTPSRAPVPRMRNLLSDSVASTIPETSPAVDRLRPMTEIAEISLSIANNEEFDDLPGFGIDADFNEAIGVSIQRTPKRQLQFQPLAAATPSPIDFVPTGSAATNSSGLSSVPSTLDPPTPFAKGTTTPAVRQVSEEESVDANLRQEEQSTKSSDLTPSVQTCKADPGKALSTSASTENDTEQDLRSTVEEPELPLSTRRRGSVPQDPPRKSTRTPKSQPKQSTHPKPQTRVARNTRLSSVSSTVSISALSTTESEMVSAAVSRSNSSTSSRPKLTNPAKAKDTKEETPLPAAKRGRPRRSIGPKENEVTMSVPTSKRKSVLPPHDDSEDPLALSAPSPKTVIHSKKSIGKLFDDMAFAVSYVGAEKDKQVATRLIKQHGGRILEDGFEELFAPMNSPSKSRTEDIEIEEAELEVASSQANVGFVALIADDHSRKAKYMQALALGLPCISGRWISHCVNKGIVIDWLPYLLSAGNSSFLGGVVKSRYLRPYPASNATLNDTLVERPRLLKGKSILIVTGKGKAGEKRKPYTFLTRALGPLRLGQAQDLTQARKMLLDAESKNANYDWLYVDGKQDVDAVVFENTPTNTAGRKRKRASIQEEDVSPPLPKRIRVVNDDIIIQSLILGQLIED